MMYNSILARSFSRYEQKKFRYGALFGCLLIVLSFCTVFKPYFGPLQVLNLRVSMGVGLKMLIVRDATSSQRVFKETNSSTYMKDENISNSQARVVDHIDNSSQQIVKNTSSSSQYVLENVNSSRHVVDDTNNSSLQIINNIRSSSQYILENINSSRHVVDDKNNSSHQMVRNTSNFQQMVTNTSSFQQMVKDNNSSQLMQKDFFPKKVEPVCNILKRSDFCEIKDSTRIDGSSATVFIASIDETGISKDNISWIIRPYARKGDETAMNRVRQWSVESVMDPLELPRCTKNHSVPAILFSSGGYAGNHFHDFSDIVIPLFLTSRQFNGEVQFLITNKEPWWIEKFRKLLNKLSRYDIIDIDKEKDVHCFPGGIIGLKRYDHKELIIDPSKSSLNMKDFRQFLRSSYSLHKATAIKLREGEKKRPLLLIISRKRTRAFTNTGEIAQMARKLGYKVVVGEATMDVSKFAELVNSCDVLLGVHGAGLTNIVFLPERAVFIQVVPLGIEWLAGFDFGEPSKAMNLRYLEYKIKAEESSLIQQYPLHHEVFRNPSSIGKQGWNAFKSIYLDKQNVQLDLNRFKGTLLQVLELLHQ